MPSPAIPPPVHNLLDEPLLGVEDERGRREKVTLPGLLARLSNGKDLALTAVQAHQQHAVHAFLVQLAAIALARGNTREPPSDERAWRELLAAAAKRDDTGVEAFALVVADLGKPAFLQPAVPEGTLTALKNTHARPSDELDVLITSKNMDVKMGRVEEPSVEHWVYALITLQTMQGFLGAGNYGIARMNGGFASRPCVAFAPSYGAGARFVRDLDTLLGARDSLISERGYAKRGELGLVWCAPWDGTKPVSIADLDPFFIEICRRVRLTVASGGRLEAHRGSSAAARVAAKELNGYTGDAWTPVADKDGKALTMSEAGFGYERVQDLLFGAWKAGAAGTIRPESADRLWLGQVLVRGQGKTGGYHERWVPMPPKARRKFARADDRAKLGQRAKAWVERAAAARLKVLKPALLTLLQGAPEKLKFDDNRVDHHLRRLDVAIDGLFFPLLFEHVDDAAELADATFEKTLVQLARSELDRALESLPVPSARRWRAEAHAYRVFNGAARKNFKLAFAADAATSPDLAPTEGDSP